MSGLSEVQSRARLSYREVVIETDALLKGTDLKLVSLIEDKDYPCSVANS